MGLSQNSGEVPKPDTVHKVDLTKAGAENNLDPTSLKEAVKLLQDFVVNEEIVALRRSTEEMITMMKEHLSSFTSKPAYDQHVLPSRGILQDGAHPPRRTPSTLAPLSCCSVMRHTGSDSR